MKIRAYLALMVAATLIPVIIFSTISISTLLDAQREAVLRASRETMRAVALGLDKEISVAEASLRVLSTSTNLAQENWHALYKQARASNPAPEVWTLLLDENGQQIFNTIIPYGTPLPPPVAKLRIQEVLRLNKPAISNLLIGPITQAHVLVIDFPVTLPNGKRYVLTQTFRANYFNQLLSPPEGSGDIFLGIFDREGKTIARNKGPDSFIGKPPNDDLLQAMLKNREGTIRNLSRDGTKLYTLFSRSQKTGWTIALGIPENQVEALARSAIRVTSFGLIAALILALITAVLFGRQLNNSISRAVDSAIALGKGEIPPPFESGIQEVEHLQKALNDAGVLLQTTETERAILLISEKAARNYAEEQNKAKDNFLAMLGHELRNPLAPISAAAELLKNAPLSEALVQKTSAVISRQTGHLIGLVNDLLDMSRVTKGLITLDKHQVEIRRVVSDAVEQVRPLNESRQHHLVVHLPHEAIYVMADQKRLVQVLSNLLANSAKYTPNGGNISINVDLTPSEVTIKVSDNGLGMAPELVNRAFDLFSQAERAADRSQGGLGLGLALVKNLVELHGGKVTAQSKGVGLGSDFIVQLPRISYMTKISKIDLRAELDSGDEISPISVSSPISSTPPMPIITPPPMTGLRLLIVDDNADAATMLGLFLEASGHSVKVENESQKGLDIACAEAPDVCLLDIGLAGMDGNELARRLRAHPTTANTILIAITGYGQEHDKENSLAAGFNYHFVKPVDVEMLSDLLAKELKERNHASQNGEA